MRADLHSIRLRALGATIDVREVDAAEAAELERVWARCSPQRIDGGSNAAACAEGQCDHAVIDRALHVDADPRTFGETVVSDVTLAAIASRIGTRILLHGAALTHPDTRRTIALVGPSGAGKTTATSALGQTLEYLSDEIVSIDDELDVEVFAKPLSLLEHGVRPKTQRSPDELGLRPAAGSHQLGVIALLGRVQPRDDETLTLDSPPSDGVEVTRLQLIDGLRPLIEQSSSLSALDRGLVRLCRVIDSCGGVVQLRYREASTLGEPVRWLLDHEAHGAATDAGASAGGWRPLAPSDYRVDEMIAPPTAAGTWVRRRTVDDAIAVDDSIVVLTHDRFAVIAGLGTVIWRTAHDWLSLDDIETTIVAQLGAHEHASQFVAEAIKHLADALLIDLVENQGGEAAGG